MRQATLVFILSVLPFALSATARSIADIRRSAKPGDLVNIQGTVTGRGGWYANLHDGTGGVAVYDRNRFVFCELGDVLRITGKVGLQNGEFHIMMARCERIGFDPEAAKPISVTPTELLAAKGLDYRSVNVRGVVADAFRDELDPKWIFFFFSPLNNHAAAAIYDPEQKIMPTAFIDAVVVVTGTYQAKESNGRPHLGPHVQTFFPDTVRMLVPPNKDPFRSQMYSRSESDTGNDGHRQRLSGTVLANWNGDSFFLKTAQGLRFRIHICPGSLLPSPGDRVIAAGFPYHNIFFTEFFNALCRTEPSTGISEEIPVSVSPTELLMDDKSRRMLNYHLDGHLIRLCGNVISVSSQDTKHRILFLLCEGETVKVELGDIHPPSVNSKIEVTGICRFSCEENGSTASTLRLNGFALLPRTPDDIKIIRRPPWWTPSRIITAVLILIVLVLTGLVWNLILQKLIARKGRELARESLAHLKAELRVDERTALAVELHDTIAQNLTGVSMQMEGVDEAHRIGSPRLGELIGKARHALDSCRTELRNCLWDLRNDAFDSDDVSAIIRKAIAPHLGSASADVKLDLQRSHISDSTFHALLCIIRELVINAVRHGKATQVDIRGETTATALKIIVQDNGCGFDPNDRPGPAEGHFGLLGIQERLDRIGGTFDISSSPGHGAEFTITIES